ncbi:MAG TPA: 16S rRNA (guanine(527)-N(7))-methyltransferase RsmG [Candidatus Acidoferrales bacterium]|nr:16S rRNA (guanine(527)-N(7))-methyltransferase RsmG [Candidatus Acidoferrales bacterium]
MADVEMGKGASSMKALTAVDIQRILLAYGYAATNEYGEIVCAYIELLLRWNRKVALTTVTEPQEVVRFHFGESLFGMAKGGMQNGRLADLGSGAGFPGAPIAIAKPELTAVLMESNGKKAAFLEEVRRELGLKNVTVHHGRAEQVPPTAAFDFVTVRAVGERQRWLEWAAERMTVGARMLLWVNADGAAEAGRASGWKWVERAKIPGTNDRFVVIGEREA